MGKQKVITQLFTYKSLEKKFKKINTKERGPLFVYETDTKNRKAFNFLYKIKKFVTINILYKINLVLYKKFLNSI